MSTSPADLAALSIDEYFRKRLMPVAGVWPKSGSRPPETSLLSTGQALSRKGARSRASDHHGSLPGGETRETARGRTGRGKAVTGHVMPRPGKNAAQLTDDTSSVRKEG